MTVDLQGLVALRHRLHRHPETAFDVEATATLVAERLRAHGWDVVTGVGGTGVVGTLRRGARPAAIGLRAELDALPIVEANTFPHRSLVDGAFHGCGHDGHATMLLGAAEALADDDRLDGTVHVVFQPDEENGRGAQAMIDDGLFDRFPMDAIFGLHNLPGLPVGHLATGIGAFTCFEEVFTIDVHGSGGHASAPERTVDPLVPAAELVGALQAIVSRAVAPHEHAVVSVTEFVTDGARNIIPSHVTLRGDVRGYDDAVGNRVRTRMAQVVAGVAAAHGASAELRYEREFAPVVNTPEQVDRAREAAGRVRGMTVDATHERVGFSEGFAQFLHHVPGCFVLLGNGTDPAHGPSLHHPAYDFNDASLPFGVAWWHELVRGHLT